MEGGGAPPRRSPPRPPPPRRSCEPCWSGGASRRGCSAATSDGCIYVSLTEKHLSCRSVGAGAVVGEGVGGGVDRRRQRPCARTTDVSGRTAVGLPIPRWSEASSYLKRTCSAAAPTRCASQSVSTPEHSPLWSVRTYRTVRKPRVRTAPPTQSGETRSSDTRRSGVRLVGRTASRQLPSEGRCAPILLRSVSCLSASRRVPGQALLGLVRARPPVIQDTFPPGSSTGTGQPACRPRPSGHPLATSARWHRPAVSS